VRVGRWWLRAGLVVAITVASTGQPVAAGPGDVPDGLISGRPHIVRLRPQLSELATERGNLTRRQRTAAAAEVASCDPARVAALERVPTTRRRDDVADACVVLATSASERPPSRMFLGPAPITGDEILDVRRRRASKNRYEVVLRLTERGAARFAAEIPDVALFPLRLDVDGHVVGTASVLPADGGDAARGQRVVISGARLDGGAASAMVDLIDQGRSEQLIELVHRSTMTPHARELMGFATARVDDKPEFVADCPNPEAAATLVLGCYDGRIFVLRVDRPDLAGVMTVTAAHEMLHAAYEEMSRAERRRVVEQLNAFMEQTGDPRIEELLVEYDRLQPGTRANELHSLVATQVRDLPRPLERYYREFFTDRSAIVDAFDGYQRVFDELQERYDQLAAEVEALDGRMDGAQAELDAAGAEADRLSNEIESLRDQGRIDESNALVDTQNAAADRANSLVESFNALVDEYNAKVFELNALAITLNDTYNEISPIPLEPA